MGRGLELGAVVLAALAACNFDASGVAEGGTGDSTSGGPSTTSTSSTSTTSPTTSATTLDTSMSVGESTSTSGSTDASSDSVGESTSTGGESRGESTSTGEPEPCLALLWVSNTADAAGTTDAPLQAHLESLGYVVTRVIDDQAEAADADGYCAVLLSAVSDSVDIESEFRDVTVPVLVWEFALFDNMGFAVEASEYGLDDPAAQIDIVDAGHPLAAGLDGTITLYSGTGRVNWAIATDAAIVGVRNDGTGHASLFAYEPGDTLADGGIAAGRRVGLPFCNATMGELQPDALALLAAAVQWATAP